MTSKDRLAGDREALERLLEIHGADRTRWPARERLKFAGLVSEDKQSARMLAEADALDRLLDRASRPSEENVEALKQRIVAAALRQQRPQLSTIEGGGGKPETANKAWFGQLRRPSWKYSLSDLPAAAVLAASLVLGVMLGTTGTLDATMQQMAGVAGFSSSADATNLASNEEVLGSGDEDLL